MALSRGHPARLMLVGQVGQRVSPLIVR